MTLATTGSMKNAALSWKDRRRRRRSSRERDRRLEAERGGEKDRSEVVCVSCLLVFGVGLTSSEVCPGGEGEGGEGEAGSSMVGPVSHQGGSY